MKNNSNLKSKSRLIREDDENDHSEDEVSGNLDNQQRVSLNYREKIHQERLEARTNFLAFEQSYLTSHSLIISQFESFSIQVSIY